MSVKHLERNISKNYQENEEWFVPGWFENWTPEQLEREKRNAKTLCALVARKQKTLGDLS